MGGADDPGTIVDDITPEDAIDCTGARVVHLPSGAEIAQNVLENATLSKTLGVLGFRITLFMFVRWKSS